MRRILLATALSAVFAGPALADCKRLAFSVNDYGKDGPIRDAKALLDTYIKEWAGKNGVAKYRTGKKDVSCELFLDVGLFDEHTCKASATVCWDKADRTSGKAQAKTKAPGTSTAKASKPKAKPARKPVPKVEAPVEPATPASAAPKKAT